jgi:type III restriction enzyme
LSETLPSVTLAKFQQDSVDALSDSLVVAAEYMIREPANRQRIAHSAGVMLLESPTGSGKTLMLGRTLEKTRGRLPERCVWFWFTPYTGLVDQTREALAAECPSLRLRALAKDRDAVTTRDGDVFVQTWQSVAKANKESLRVRRTTEDGSTLDAMLADLRDTGVHIGVVIDEAHLNFGVNARAAADFYLNALRPDFTLLATATPNDQKLAAFEAAAG